MKQLTREQYEAELREQIERGEITPEAAESEWDFFVNGPDTFQNIYGI